MIYADPCSRIIRVADTMTVELDGMVKQYFDHSACSLFSSVLARVKPQVEGPQKYREEMILVDERSFWD